MSCTYFYLFLVQLACQMCEYRWLVFVAQAGRVLLEGPSQIPWFHGNSSATCSALSCELVVSAKAIASKTTDWLLHPVGIPPKACGFTQSILVWSRMFWLWGVELEASIEAFRQPIVRVTIQHMLVIAGLGLWGPWGSSVQRPSGGNALGLTRSRLNAGV